MVDGSDDAATDGSVGYVRHLVETTLTRLGQPASGLRIHDISPAEQLPPPRPGLQAGRHLRITVGPDSGPVGPSTIWAYFTLTASVAEATVATVEQLQDHVIELAHGPAVPPCPGHQHPLQPAVLDGTPSWVCPADPRRYSEPILAR